VEGAGADSLRFLRLELAVARLLADAEDIERVGEPLLATLATNLGWEHAAVWEPGPDGDLVRAVAWTRPGAGDLDPFEAQARALRLGSGEGLPGRVWAAREPVWITDVTEEANFPRSAAAAEAGLHAALGFPVLGEGDPPLGVIEVLTSAMPEPDPALLTTLESVGRQVGRFLEHRAAERTVRQNEALLQATLDAALDAVITMDHDGRIVAFNRAAETIFGYRSDSVAGHEMAETIVPPSLRAQHRNGLARYLETGESRILGQRLEITGMRADGSEFPVELTITRIPLVGPPMFTGHVRDISDRVGMLEELRASRARLVTAGDEARQRLERDLHDGAQQRLVATALDLRLAREELEAGESEQGLRLLGEVEEDLMKATAELRELARGIHPGVLTRHGLAVAVKSLAGRASFPVELRIEPGGSLPQPIEAAAYFVVAEALTNVARYAEASRAEVEILATGEGLAITVGDDGRGGARLGAGTGLLGLRDRVAALGGALEVVSPDGGGTVVRARLPLDP
jgi:PAS domain S-box-containing protein